MTERQFWQATEFAFLPAIYAGFNNSSLSAIYPMLTKELL